MSFSEQNFGLALLHFTQTRESTITVNVIAP